LAEEKLYSKLETSLGYTFKDQSWIERALTHRSFSGKGEDKYDYERLEFLGDAVLGLAIAHLLLEKHPDANEGELSKMRAALVNTASLAEIARGLELGPLIKLSRSEQASGGSERPSILADVVEALLGAEYREAGFAAVLKTVSLLFDKEITEVQPSDPKTELQEVLHAIGNEVPEYLLEFVEGPEHAPTFISVVKINGGIHGRGRGNTKKASQQEAAKIALEALKSGSQK
jgi:ribonuclease-3